MASQKLEVIITGDSTGAESAFSKVGASAGGLEGKLKGVGQATEQMGTSTKAASDKLSSAGGEAEKTGGRFQGMGATIAKAAVLLGGVAFFKGVFEQGQAAEKIMGRMETVIRNSGSAAHVTAKQIGEWATSLSNATGIEKSAIEGAAASLLKYQNVRNELGKGNDIFKRATADVLDLAAATGIALPKATTLLGKALNDPIAGMKGLSKLSITLTDDQKRLIEQFVASGDTLSAQKVILDAVEKKFGGVAAGSATAADKMKASFTNMKESIATVLAPAVDKAAEFGAKIAGGFSELPKSAQTVILSITGIVGAVGYLGPKVKDAIEGFKGLGAAWEKMSSGAQKATLAFGAIGIAVAVAVAAFKAFTAEGDKNAAATRALGDAAKATGASIHDTLVKQLGDTSTAAGQFGAGMQKMGISLKDVATGITGTDKQFAALQNRVVNAGGQFSGFGKTVGNLRQQFTSASQGASETAKNTAKLGSSLDGAKEKVKGVGGAFLTSEQATKAYAKATEAVKTAADKAKTSIDAVAAALKRAFSDTTSLTGAQIAAEAAFDGLTKSLMTNGRNMDINTQAGRDNKTALIGLGGAAYDTAAAIFKQSGSAVLAQGSMTGYANRTAEAGRSAGRSEGEIQAMLQTMGLTPAQIQTAFKTAGISQANQDINALNAAADAAARARTLTITVGYAVTGGSANEFGGHNQVPPGRALGGTVMRGQAYVVGETRPELFVPDRNGTIIPNVPPRHNKGAGVDMNGGDEGGSTVVVNVAGSVLSERDLIGVITRAQRRGVHVGAS